MTDQNDDIPEWSRRVVNDSPGRERSARRRPFICVYFDCCDVYNRIYRNRQGAAYVGWCPRCAKKVTVRVGPDGVEARFFRAK